MGMYVSEYMFTYTHIFSLLHFTLLYCLALLQVLIIRAYFQKYNPSSYMVSDSAKIFEITALGSSSSFFFFLILNKVSNTELLGKIKSKET